MAGPNLEVFKFALYLFFPLSMMVHYGKPEWYTAHVQPYRDKLFPPLENTHRDLPSHQAGIKEELEKFKAQRRAKRVEQDQDSGTSTTQ